MRLVSWIAGSFMVLGLVACGDSTPEPVDGGVQDTGVQPDTGLPDTGTPDVGPGPDAGPGPDVPQIPPDFTSVQGKVVRLDAYLRGVDQALFNANVSALGVQGVLPTTSDAEGYYTMIVPREGKIVFEATKGAHYTSYEEVEVGADPVQGKNLYLATEPWVSLLASTYNVDITASFPCHAPNPTAEQCYYAIVVGQIVDDGTEENGRYAPQAGIAQGDFTIEGNGDATWYKKGPYFLGADGTPNSAYTSSQRERDPATNYYRGGLFVTFLEVPSQGRPDRDFKFTISSTQQGQSVYYGPLYAKAFRQGLTWVKVYETGRENPPPPPPPVNDPVDFDTQVYPLFLPVNQGGLGCQGCHTNQGGNAPSGGMNLYGGADLAYQALNPASYPQRVNLQNPTQSYLLSKPLYEANGQQDHPIYAFANELDPNYELIYRWIQQGAVRNVNVPPQVSFYNEIRPLLYQPSDQGGIGCYACHVDGVNANNAPGGAYFGGNGNELHQVLTQDAATDNGQSGEPYRINKQGNAGYSLLLTNPLQGAPEPHPVKLFYGAEDPRYQLIYTWIQQGYVNDTP